MIEVAEATLSKDRGLKAAVYAEAGIRIYWIVNLIERQVEVYSDPTGPTAEPGYRSHRVYGTNDAVPFSNIEPTPLPMSVRELLPSIPTAT